MKTVSSLLDTQWYERYKNISRLNIRSSIYDVTNRCNLRCKGCFFFSSGEHKVPRDRFPDLMVGISLWGDADDEKILRGRDTFQVSSDNYAGDPHAYYL